MKKIVLLDGCFDNKIYTYGRMFMCNLSGRQYDAWRSRYDGCEEITSKVLSDKKWEETYEDIKNAKIFEDVRHPNDAMFVGFVIVSEPDINLRTMLGLFYKPRREEFIMLSNPGIELKRPTKSFNTTYSNKIVCTRKSCEFLGDLDYLKLTQTAPDKVEMVVGNNTITILIKDKPEIILNITSDLSPAVVKYINMYLSTMFYNTPMIFDKIGNEYKILAV